MRTNRWFYSILLAVMIPSAPLMADDAGPSRLTITCEQFSNQVHKVAAYVGARDGNDIEPLFIQSIRSRLATGILTLKANPEKALPGGRYVMTQNIWGDVLETPTVPRLVTDFDELRYSPFFSENTDLVVYADDASPLTLSRVEKLLRVASAFHLRFHMVWLGESLEQTEKVRLAKILAISSGGQLVLLGRDIGCLSHS